jgi:TATA-binding protein-associated factor Taf7
MATAARTKGALERSKEKGSSGSGAGSTEEDTRNKSESKGDKSESSGDKSESNGDKSESRRRSRKVVEEIAEARRTTRKERVKASESPN